MQYMKEASARSFFILTLVISLMFAGILNTNATIGINAFAKSSKKISDKSSNDGNSRASGSSDKGSSLDSKDNTSFKKDTKSTEPFVPPSPSPPLPLSAETPTNSKYVIINFDDSHQSDYTYAKPILDKYGFKATFFEVCNWIEAGYHDKDISVTWQQIAALQQDGMDIEAHTMNHPNLNHLSSQSDLDYEIGQSKQCLENHGFNPTIFAYPNGDGSDNPEVVNTVAKYYDLARTAESDTKSALTFLNCDSSSSSSSSNVNSEPQQQQKTYCATYLSDGELAPENRYSISSWAHKHIDEGCSTNGNDASSSSSSSSNSDTCKKFRYEYDNAQMFQKFVTAVNSEYSYNNDGVTRAIPIIVYHTIVNYPDLSDSNRPIDTTLNLFDAEMKYLHDHGFKVITMSDLGYDTNSKTLYIKGT
jgi:peptidoglycan/xylan/chitin deacetylase (PgdA/CDA1 family)